jgi:hypothetical protein
MTDTAYASDSGHWYSADGSPMYEIVGANGKLRATTLRDARKLGLYPSVTEIIKCAASPGLDIWKQQQVMMAALTLPRKLDETEADFIKRVMQDSKEEARLAAEGGQRVHASIEMFYRGEERFISQEYFGAMRAFHLALMEWFGPLFLDHELSAEQSFGCDLGYGGKVDLHNSALLVDIKTKDEVSDKMELYDSHLMQMAAYRHGLGLGEDTRCAIAFITRTAPWKVVIVEADPAELRRGWLVFKALLDFWQHSKGYYPGRLALTA